MVTLRCDEPGNRQTAIAGRQLAGDHNLMITREKAPIPWQATRKNAADHNLLFTKEKSLAGNRQPLYIQKVIAGLLYRGQGRATIRPSLGSKSYPFVDPRTGGPSMERPTKTVPTKYDLTPAQRHAALLLATGSTQAEAARAIGRARCTINGWLKRNSHFRDELDALLVESRLRLMEKLPTLVEQSLETLEKALSIPHISDTRMRAAQYVLDRVLSLLASSGALSDSDGAADPRVVIEQN